MDDILASIRKILNEDDAPGAQATSPAPPPEPLMLTEEMLVAEPPPSVQLVPAPEPFVADTVIEVPPPPPPKAAEPPPQQPIVAEPPTRPETTLMPQNELMAPAAAAAAAASMGQLLRAVSQERSATVTRGGPSIEDVVREEVRPILKEWLDAHLPGIVERAVRAEIERVVSRSL